jgi:hypothetical protein
MDEEEGGKRTMKEIYKGSVPRHCGGDIGVVVM